MTLAKRESARRGLYSRFFRGPVLSPDIEEPQTPAVVQQSLQSRLESSDLKSSVSIAEKRKGKKRKSREECEDDEPRAARKKRKSKRENNVEERKNKKRRKKRADEVVLDGEIQIGPTRVSTVPASSVQVDGTVGHFCEKDREKKRKKKDRGCEVRHADDCMYQTG